LGADHGNLKIDRLLCSGRRILRHVIPERIPRFATGLYDKVARTAIAAYYQEVAKEIVAEINCGTILDVGTGPGYLPIEIAKMAPHIEIDAIDLSKKMIEIAQNNAKGANLLQRIHFQVADANDLKFADDSYDMIISTGAFHSWKNPARVLNECCRVLKPGREAWIYDPARITTAETKRLWQEKPLRGLDWLAYKWARMTSQAMPRTCNPNEIYHIIAATDFKDYHVEQKEGIKIKLRK
jgi:ubiquinone/menaquinone biosynthesis C-methylase UbiE